MRTPVPPSIERIVDLALDEDLGRGDVTTGLTVPPGAAGAGRVIAREEMVVSGLDVFELVMTRVDPSIRMTPRAEDGLTVAPGRTLLEAAGPIASMLMGERVALNFLQRLCGVATLARRYVSAAGEGRAVRVTDTRKTTPGMRFLERRAVVHGGAYNHRVDLAGGVLIKENHIVAAGSVGEAVRRCVAGAPHPLRIEVEARTEAEVEEAVAAGADAVLLDNMDVDAIRRCVAIVGKRALVEASGGVNLGTVARIAAAGVDVISVGALTHSAPSADISFLLEGA
jgi:nicotinate-nucleotide pyrophosphorylase (carboxylating)